MGRLRKQDRPGRPYSAEGPLKQWKIGLTLGQAGEVEALAARESKPFAKVTRELLEHGLREVKRRTPIAELAPELKSFAGRLEAQLPTIEEILSAGLGEGAQRERVEKAQNALGELRSLAGDLHDAIGGQKPLPAGTDPTPMPRGGAALLSRVWAILDALNELQWVF